MTYKGKINVPIEDPKLLQLEFDINDTSSAGVITSQRNNFEESSSRVSDGKTQGPNRKYQLGHGQPPVQSSLVDKVCSNDGLPIQGINLMQMIARHEKLEEAFRQLLSKDGTLRYFKSGRPLESLNLKGKKAKGVDGKSVAQAYKKFRKSYTRIIRALLNGCYEPMPARRVNIPKADGKLRPLGIPTAQDRAIQLAILLVINPLIDPWFSRCSHGFRKGHSVHTAVSEVLKHIKLGLVYAISIDLKGFFDNVPQKPLLDLLRGIFPSDPIFLGLIEKFLKSGVEIDGKKQPTEQGTPQGGIISPLLANIYLHRLDMELIRRGLQHVRYADDFIIFAKSRRAAGRIMRNVKRFLEEEMLLQVNEAKSHVVHVDSLEYLGFAFRDGLRIAAPSIEEFKQKIRSICKRKCSDRSVEKNMKYLLRVLHGWLGHFSRINAPDQCSYLDKWFREHINKLHSAYKGTGQDPMLKALDQWTYAYQRKTVWREAIEATTPIAHDMHPNNVASDE